MVRKFEVSIGTSFTDLLDLAKSYWGENVSFDDVEVCPEADMDSDFKYGEPYITVYYTGKTKE